MPPAAPRRRNPLPALLALVAVPAIALGGVAIWAGSTEAVAEPQPNVSAPADRMVPGAKVMSLRRAPESLARSIDAGLLAAELQPLEDELNDTSCLQVDIGAQPVAETRVAAPVVPASTMKVLTAAVGLEVVGADSRFATTAVGVQGAPGTVAGDLYLVGGGDPLLSTDWYPDSLLGTKYPQRPATRLEDLADAVAAAGITTITGRVSGDASRYDDERYRPAWPDDLHVESVGPYAALMVNDARTDASGTVADDPALGAAQLFTDLLRERGVTVGGDARTGAAPTGTPEIARVESAPLSEVVHHMMTTSDNNSAEMLLKEIAVASGRAGTAADGLAVIRDTVSSWGIPVQGIDPTDGSGMDIGSLLTCQVLTGVLAHEGLDSPFGQSLAVLSKEGTLAGVLPTNPLAGIARAKTGSLGESADRVDVKALAGYVPGSGGADDLEFTMVLNGGTVREEATYLPLWEDLLDALATYPEGPGADALAPAPARPAP